MGSKSYEVMRRKQLPYGCWTCEDGRQVLFNRFYKPICQRLPGHPPQPADPDERVPFVKQEWFYNDATPESKKRQVATRTLHAWGYANFTIRKVPRNRSSVGSVCTEPIFLLCLTSA
jgi:hypothetical protein